MRTLGPQCIECGNFATLSNSSAMFADQRGRSRPLYVCTCGAYVGCHKGTTRPLGRPAGPEVRAARIQVHRKMDPLWQGAYADQRNDYKRKGLCLLARRRIYEFLAERMGLSEDECHTGAFDMPQCRQAWRLLHGLTYDDVRAWAKARAAA